MKTDADGTPIRELVLWYYRETCGRHDILGIHVGGSRKKRATHVIFYIMRGRYPMPGLVIDHIDGDPTNNRWSNLRECTVAQNMRNADRSGARWWGRDELLEAGVYKTRRGTYRVEVLDVHIGIFDNRTAANEACRNARRQLKGEYDMPFVSRRRYHG